MIDAAALDATPRAPRYDPSVPMAFQLDDLLRLKKAHPCGGTDWVVFRLGADIGLRCGTCGHRVLVPRRDLERRVVRLLRPGDSETHA